MLRRFTQWGFAARLVLLYFFRDEHFWLFTMLKARSTNMNLALGTESTDFLDVFQFLEIGKRGEERRLTQYVSTILKKKLSLLQKRFVFIVENPFMLNSTRDSSLRFGHVTAFSICMAWTMKKRTGVLNLIGSYLGNLSLKN